MGSSPNRLDPSVLERDREVATVRFAWDEWVNGKPWRECFEVHPAAKLMPEMWADGLDELGEDIKANGLKMPIQFFGNKLIDGRSRFDAMERIGFFPIADAALIEFIDQTVDPYLHVLSLNAKRRHLTKEQKVQAIIAAQKVISGDHVFAEAPKGGRGKKMRSRPPW